MDYKTMIQAVDAMTDEQLFLLEKKAHEERRRRDVLAGGYATVIPGSAQVLIEFSQLTNEIRETLRLDMRVASDAALTSVLEQLGRTVEESELIKMFENVLLEALAYEARCEASRRLDSVVKKGNDNGRHA